MSDLYFPIGSASHGTHRPDDLAHSFNLTARAVAQYYDRKGEPETGAELLAQFAKLSAEYAETIDDESKSEIVADMQETLADHAPDFTYFGTHEGDGADFGFWPDFDPAELRELDSDDQSRFDVSDHGNLTLYDRDKNDPAARIIWGIA